MKRAFAGALALAAIAGGVAVTPAGGQGDIDRKRAEVQRIEGELAGIDARLEDAANAYNGARYRLDGIQEDIRANQRRLNATEKALAVSRVRLAERMVDIYTAPRPSTMEIIVTSGSLSEAGERLRLLERVGAADGSLVRGIKADRARLAETRAALQENRRKAQREVEAAERRRQEAEQLLRQRQAVLAQARGELAAALEAERRRQAAVDAQQRREALARQQSQSRETAPAPAAPAAAPQPASAAPSAPIPSGAGNAAAASLALQYLGTPYVWGGASPAGFDCSGLASYVYGKIGKSVPHYTVAIWNAFPKVPRDQLQAGDMVFYRGLGHMGIYIGGNQYVHAPRTGDVVKVSSVSDRSDYVGAVRP